MTVRFRPGQEVVVTGDTPGGVSGKLDPIPDGELVTVFEDYGRHHIAVMRRNGQLRTVRRVGCALAPSRSVRDEHSAAAGAKCTEGRDGLCLECQAEMTVCATCGGIAYHREGCSESDG